MAERDSRLRYTNRQHGEDYFYRPSFSDTMKYPCLFLVAVCLLCNTDVAARSKRFRYPEVSALRDSLLRVVSELADSFHHVACDPETPANIPGVRSIPHIANGDEPLCYSKSRSSGPGYQNDLQKFPDRGDDSKQAFFKWQQLIAEALPEHLRTVPEWESRLNESVRYYYYPLAGQRPGILISIVQNGGDIRLYAEPATSRQVEIVHSYNDGVPYEGWHVVMIESYMYDSSFKGNHFTGDVKYEYQNGGSYRGYFVDGIPEGEGELRLPAKKEVYIGTFLNGRYHGKGKLIKENVGYTGEFRDGELVPGSYTTSDETFKYTVTTPGMERYRNYVNSVPATRSISSVCEDCKGTGLVSVMATCFSCHGTGGSGSGYKTYDAHGYETGYKSLGCGYCGGKGLYKKFKRCGTCRGKGRP